MVMSATDSQRVKDADLDACQRVLPAFRTAQPQTLGDGEPFDLVFAISCDIHIHIHIHIRIHIHIHIIFIYTYTYVYTIIHNLYMCIYVIILYIYIYIMHLIL